MAEIYHGRGAVIGLGEESTWGTAVSRTNWRPLISTELVRTIEKVPRPSLRVGAAGAMRRAHYIQQDLAGGVFSIECTYENVGLLIKHIMGTVATTGSGPYTHTYTFADDVPTGLTIENVRGTGTSEVFEGCRINTATLAVSAGGVMTMDCEVIAETSAARGSAGSASFGSGDTPVLHSHATTLSFNGATYDLVDMTLTINNALATRQHLGSAVTKKPLRADFQSVELAVTLEVSDVAYTAFTADSVSDAVITFNSGAQAFQINVHNAYISAATDPVSDANVISQSLTFVGQSDGTDEGCKIIVVNNNSSSTGN